MTREIPIRRAKIEPKNGFVVSECPKTEKPTFTHGTGGCKDCEFRSGGSEETILCDYKADEPGIKETLANAREILKNIKKD